MSLITYDYIDKNKYTRPGMLLASVKAILIHWTANPGASARNHKIYFGKGGGYRYASASIFVDLIEALCIIPLNEVAYAANETGKSKIAKLNGNYGYQNGNANGCTISVEMCVEKDGTISKAVEAKTAKVIAELCKKFGLTEKDVYRHYDVTGKACPKPFIGNTRFTLFKAKIKKELAGKKVVIPVSKTIKSKATYFKALPSTKTIQCITNVGIYKTVEFNDSTKLKDHYEPGDTIKVVAVAENKNGIPRFKTSDGQYITTNKAYVKKYTPVQKNKVIGTVTTKQSLNYYDSPRWNKPSGTTGINTFSVVAKVLVDGVYQYKLASGNYITASSKYVVYKKK